MKNIYANKTRLSIVLGVAWILSMGTGAALAGEITGNGKWIAGSEDAPLNGKSACAYSGREDEPESGEFTSSIAQAWGLLPKGTRDFLTSIGFNPGTACNPKKSGG
jgi:hypothetical protein